VVREAYEETGLHVVTEGLVDVHFFDDDPRGNGILIVYACRVVGGELRPSQEGSDPTFFRPVDLPASLAGGGHDQAVHAWQRCAGGKGPETR
jgi:ADP-ribose pyrophosphatase YjhB (NUDIX family)